MTKRNFLKWLVAIPAMFVASKLPVLEPVMKKPLDPLYWINDADPIGDFRRAMKMENDFLLGAKPNEFIISENVYDIITDSSDNIEEFIKS